MTPPTRHGTRRPASGRRPSQRRPTAGHRSLSTRPGERRVGNGPLTSRSVIPRRRQNQTAFPVTLEGQRLSAMIGLLALGLTLFGLVMVLSASSVTSVHEYADSPFYTFKRQLVWAVLGGIAYIVSSRFDYRRLEQMAPYLLGATVVLLVAVLVPGLGRNVNGSSRWLGAGPVVIQPSELTKFALVTFVAALLTRRGARMDRPDLTVRPVVVVLGLLSVLLILQPKLGTPLILAAIAGLMLFVAGARLSSLLGWASVGAVMALLAAYFEPYRRDRLLAFVNPWDDPLGKGLQTIQSQVGIASGGLFGVGLGASRTKWGFLPFAHTDFIFAIVAEEIGLIGAGALILSFLLLGLFGIRAALGARDRFGMLLAAGITCWLLLQAFLNMGMAIGLLPITGEPLPFVSAGGSSLVMTLAAAGVLASVARGARPSRP